MGRIFDDATPEEDARFIDERRRDAFVRDSQYPILWGILAERHMRAADYLYEIAYAAAQRDLARSFARFRDGITGSHELAGQELQDYRDVELLSEYLLLAAYGLECITKGILMLQLPDLVVSEARLDRRIRTHDLPTLCSECGLKLNDDERRLLGVVTRYVQWGKYPVPTKYEDMPSQVDPDDDRLKDLSVGNAFHERRVQVLIRSVYGRAAEAFVPLREAWRERQ